MQARPDLAVAAGLCANLALLALPALASGAPGALLAPDVLLFLAGASALCLADAQREWWAAGAPERLVPGRLEVALAWVGGPSLLLVWWLALLDRLQVGPPGPWASAAFVVMVAGAALRAASVRALRGAFRTLVGPPPDSRLRRDGPYRQLRHPAETGLLIAAGAGCAVLGSVLGLAACILLLLPLAVLRAAREETVLLRAMGDEYRRYRGGTGAFWPRRGAVTPLP